MPDFSKTDSLKKAISLVQEGILEPLFLVPVEFGGIESEENTVYVPVGLAKIKIQHDLNVVMPLIQQGLVKEYQAIPLYEGSSFVPKKIQIRASNPREVNFELSIW